jgi:hypothetical protein
MCCSADSISFGDNLTTKMRTENAWSLLPQIGFTSCIAPSIFSGGFITHCKFPEYGFMICIYLDGWEKCKQLRRQKGN